MAIKVVTIGSSGLPEETSLGIQTSGGAGDANKIILTDSSGKLDSTFLPPGVGEESMSIAASETMSGPALVNVWKDGSDWKVRYADASNAAKQANGFILESVSSGANVTVYFTGEISGLTSIGAGRYFLSATPGAPTATAPSTSGHIAQVIGFGVSDTSIMYQPGQPIVRA